MTDEQPPLTNTDIDSNDVLFAFALMAVTGRESVKPDDLAESAMKLMARAFVAVLRDETGVIRDRIAQRIRQAAAQASEYADNPWERE